VRPDERAGPRRLGQEDSMGGLSIWHWMIVLVVVLLLFGSGKVSGLMGDFAKGIKSFKKNMAEDESMEAGADQPGGTIAGPHTTTTTTTAATPRETVVNRS
jgi:sec-independent protein translocase protein TatA